MTMWRPVTVVTSEAISKNDASKIGLAAEAALSGCWGRSPKSISKRLSVTKIPFAESDSRMLIPANARSVSFKYSSVLKQKMRSYLPPFLAARFRSEERRVGKECRTWRTWYYYIKKK